MYCIFPEYEGRRIVITSRVVDRELMKIGLNLWGVKEILEFGFDCPLGRRKPSIEEKCIKVGNKIIKVVVELKQSRTGIEFWKLRHVGMFSYKKERFR